MRPELLNKANMMAAGRNGRWAKALRRRLREWDMTQTDMAKVVGYDVQRVNDWVKGRYEPSDQAKPVLMDKLNISAEEVAPDWLRDAAVSHVGPRPDIPAREVA